MNRKTNRWTHMCLYTLIFASAGCRNQEMQEATEVEDNYKKPQLISKENMGAAPAKISLTQQIQGAITDLANRSGIADDAIAVKEARSVQWGSSAMGCPKPGMNYTQALVPGVRLLLEAEGTIYYYHGGTGTSLFYCPADIAQVPAYGQGLEVM